MSILAQTSNHKIIPYNELPNPGVSLNEWPNPPWNTVPYEWDGTYEPCSPEWFAQARAKSAMKTGLRYSTEDTYAKHRKQVTVEQAQTTTAQGGTCANIGVLSDTHLYILVDKQVQSRELIKTPEHIGDILQIALDANLETVWIAPKTGLSEAATPNFIEAAREEWHIKTPRYSRCVQKKDADTGEKRTVTTEQSRCMFLSAWKEKEHRTSGESGRMLYVGYAEHNEDWALQEVTRPTTLLLALSYIEDALGVPVRFSAGHTGKQLIEETNKKRRAEWVKHVDIAAIEPALKNPVMSTEVVDIAWKRALTDEERAMPYLVAYDKNSMYSASCTSVLLGESLPSYQTKPHFDVKKPLPGVWHCSVSGSSQFDGINLPHPLEGLRYTEENGVISGWFWTYTVKLLQELGYTVEIDAAYVWNKEHAHTTLRPFAEEAWKARASLNDKYEPDTTRYPDKDARAASVNAMKLVQVKSLGWLGMTTKVKKAGEAYYMYRPDWYALLKDNARYQMFWRIRSIIEKTGRTPIGIHADCLYYTADTDNHEHAIPRMMERYSPGKKQYEPAQTKLGGFKRKFKTTITVEQSAPLFDTPEGKMAIINKALLDMDKATMKQQEA